MVNPVLLMLLKSRVMDLALSLLPVITYRTSSVNKILEKVAKVHERLLDAL
jgi:hypothetical protein